MIKDEYTRPIITNLLSMPAKQLEEWKIKIRSLHYKLEPVTIPKELVEALKPHGNKWFCKISKPIQGNRKSGKSAFESGFLDNLYSADDQELLEWLRSGGNYAIVAQNKLAWLDADDPLIVKLFEQNFGETFTTKTGRLGEGGYHFYFITDLDENVTLLRNVGGTIKDNNIGNIQVKRKYVVGPGSLHNSGRRYKIIKNVPIRFISKEKLEQVFGQYWCSPSKKIKRFNKIAKKELNKIGNRIPIIELIPNLDEFIEKKNGEYQGSHPIHGSEGGQNFAFNTEKNSWYCYRCNSGGGALSWIAVKTGLIKCHEAKSGILRGKLYIETLKKARELGYKIDVEEAEKIEEIKEKFFSGKKTKIVNLAREILDENIYITREDDEMVYVYEPKEGRYKAFGEHFIEKEVVKKLDIMWKSGYGAEVLKYVKIKTYKSEMPETPLHLFAFKNGIYNIETDELLPFSPNYFILNAHPVEYNPKAKCPRWMQFLQEVLKTDEDRMLLQEWFGFCLYRVYFLKRVIIFVGDRDAGKTTALYVLQNLLGEKNFSAISLQALESDKFKTVKLYGKCANIGDDLPKITSKDLSKIKKASGRSILEGEYKFKTSFEFISYAKLTFSANAPPELPTDDPAIWSRFIMLDFPNRFPEHDPKTDKFLGKKLQNELPGILNWALEGLKRLLKNQRFSKEMTAESTSETYTLRSNPEVAFFEEHVTTEFDAEILKSKLFEKYKEFCKENDIYTVCGIKTFGKRLREHFGFGNVKHKKTNKGRVWTGIKLVETEEQEQDKSVKQDKQDKPAPPHPSDNARRRGAENIKTVDFDKMFSGAWR